MAKEGCRTETTSSPHERRSVGALQKTAESKATKKGRVRGRFQESAERCPQQQFAEVAERSAEGGPSGGTEVRGQGVQKNGRRRRSFTEPASLGPEYEEQEEYEQKLEREEEPQPEDQQTEEQQERICDDQEEKPREEHENHQNEDEGETEQQERMCDSAAQRSVPCVTNVARVTRDAKVASKRSVRNR